MAYLEVGNLTTALQLLEKMLYYSRGYPDFPKNGTIVPPRLLDPNYVPERRFNPVVPLTITTTVIYSAFVLARLYTRRFCGARAFGADDWLMSLAWLIGIVFSITTILLVTEGHAGENAFDQPYHVLKIGELLEQCNFFLYVMTHNALRFSVLAFFIRLAGSVAVTLRRLAILTIWFQVAFAITTIYVVWFSCDPFRASWDLDSRLVGGNCYRRYAAILATAIILSITDYWIVCLPIPTVLSLKAPLRARLGLAVLFSIGLVGSVCGTVRIWSIPGSFNSYNQTWNGLPVLIWDQLELSFGFIAASLPALNVWFVKAIPESLKRSANSSPRHHIQSIKATPVIMSSDFRRIGLVGDPEPSREPSREPSHELTREYTSESTRPLSHNSADLTLHDEEAMFMRETPVFIDGDVIQPLPPNYNVANKWRTKRWNPTFGYMNYEGSNAGLSVNSQLPWDLELGQPRDHDLPDIEALTQGSVTVLRKFTTTKTL